LKKPKKMNKEEIIQKTMEYVVCQLDNAEKSHDWFHVQHVWQMAKYIAERENVDVFICELAALLHDISDAKFNGGDELLGAQKSKAFLESLSIDKQIIDNIFQIVANVSFKGGNFATDYASPELFVVRDADRLDAIGAKGIARAFHYGGYKNRAIYDPNIQPRQNISVEAYRNDNQTTINHFYEKLLLLKDLMHTPTARKLAEERHAYMVHYLEQFFKELQISN
jgi:uncharacterized protein